MIYINQLPIDWEKESSGVRTSLELTIKAFNAHSELKPEEKERYSKLFDIIFKPEEKK